MTDNAIKLIFRSYKLPHSTDQPWAQKCVTLEKSILDLEKKLQEISTIVIEKKEKRSNTKKLLTVAVVSAITIVTAFGVYSDFYELVGQQYRVENPDNFNSRRLIQNLKGDIMNTWLSWRLVEGEVLYVNIVNADKFSEEKIDVIKQALLSEEEIDIDNSLTHKGTKGTTSQYFLGWQGALIKASEETTEVYIPVKFEIIESNQDEGDIRIELLEEENADGFSGQTLVIADDGVNQILKSKITIFDVDELTPEQLNSITRHEVGHALGLGHSTAPEDLMYPMIETGFPYISECNIRAIVSLYEEGKPSEFICEK